MEDPVVAIHQGTLRGSTGLDHAGGKYYSFFGIPYAKPPLGELRFKSPRPPEGWSGVRNAFEEGDECYSRHPVLRHIVGSEDCLFLNVFTRELPNNTNITKKLKPVMVWIHGGGFNAGSSKLEFYGPEFLLPEDIVFVSFNYRLGVLGFLALDDPELGVPGNAGLKDMVMALKWVQNNIHFFMGDPNNVTIFGQSAGAAAVHYLVLSPMAKGLFHRAIAQSGSALNSWAQGRRICWELANILECNVTTEKELLQVLQNISVEKLFAAQEEIKDIYYASELRPNGPVIEKISKNEPNFLLHHPIDILLSGNYNKVPMIFGYATREGMILAHFDKKTVGEIKIVEDFETTVPIALGFSKGSHLSKLAAKKIKQFYFGCDEPGLHNLDKYYMMHTDNFFLRGIYSSIRNHIETSTSPIYLYRFSVETSLNVYKTLGELTLPGVCHVDDLGYLFKTAVTPEIHDNSIEEISIKRITKLWTTFARYGNPNPKEHDPLINVKWNPVSKNKIHFLDFGENLTVGVNPEEERMKFWDQIYCLNPTKSKL